MKRYVRAAQYEGAPYKEYRGYSIDKVWATDPDGNRLPRTTKYQIVDSEDDWVGDFCDSYAEAKKQIDEWEDGPKTSVKSSTLPDGYLRTTRFNSRINEEDYNVLEAIEIAITEKWDQWDKFMERQIYLTSDNSWNGVVDEYPEGYYIILEGTRSGFNAFVQGDRVIRKPVKLSERIKTYNVSGDGGHVDYIRPAKQRITR